MTRTPVSIKSTLILSCCVIFAAAVLPVYAEPNPKTTLLRVEVQDGPGETVKVSVPLELIDTLYTAMPKEIHEACEQLELTPETIYKELASMEGEDLVRITGEDQVRVWFEDVKPENQKDMNFVTVFVKEKKEGGDEVNVKVPKGLIKLAARVIKELDIVEECIDLPPEVRKALDKIKEKKEHAANRENVKISENSPAETNKEEPKSE